MTPLTIPVADLLVGQAARADGMARSGVKNLLDIDLNLLLLARSGNGLLLGGSNTLYDR